MKKSIIRGVAHIGITVSDIDTSKEFYGKTLGLPFSGEMIMEGEATDLLFGMESCVVKVAYFSTGDNSPKVELIEFVNHSPLANKSQLNRLSISELCFDVEDIDTFVERLRAEGVEFLSKPQYFDLTAQGFGCSKAVYLKDPDGNILEFIETLEP